MPELHGHRRLRLGVAIARTDDGLRRCCHGVGSGPFEIFVTNAAARQSNLSKWVSLTPLRKHLPARKSYAWNKPTASLMATTSALFPSFMKDVALCIRWNTIACRGSPMTHSIDAE